MEPNAEFTIAIVQRDIVARSVEANLHGYELQLHEAKAPLDLILLPEMFPSGFIARTTRHAEPPEGPSLQWMRHIAWERNALVCGSIATREAERCYNRFYLVTPAGNAHQYDKRHLFPLAGEDKVFTPGCERIVVEFRGWRILPQICYDLRFPESSRNYRDYDLLLYSAVWPAARANAWSALLKARAIENQCYLAACNRVGRDEEGISYRGDSMVLSPAGKALGFLPPNTSGLIVARCTKQSLTDFRARYPFLPSPSH